MYTERYLGLPIEKDNKKGYEASSLVRKARKLDGKKYMLIHGTMDDNVHYQQSMMLARSMELNDVLFRQQVGFFVIDVPAPKFYSDQ
jgi:dipeptidyl-peptidase-4